jgi:hypothetical protein
MARLICEPSPDPADIAARRIGSYLRYTGHHANAVTKAALDPVRTSAAEDVSSNAP